MNYLYGFTSAAFVYWTLSHCFPAEQTLLKASIYDDTDVLVGVQPQVRNQRTADIVLDDSKSQVAVFYADSRAGGRGE